MAVILPSGATIPVNPAYSVEGQTQVIGDTIEVVLAASTTVELPSQIEPTIPPFQGITTTLPGGTVGLILAAGATVPVNAAYSPNGYTTVMDGTTEVVLPAPTTIELLSPKEPSLQSLSGITTILSGGETSLILPSGAVVPVDLKLSLSGRTTVVGGKTEVILTAPQTIPLQTKTSNPDTTKSFHGGATNDGAASNTQISLASNSGHSAHDQKTAISDSTKLHGTGSNIQMTASPTSVPTKQHKSPSTSTWHEMNWTLAASTWAVLIWSFS